MRLASVLLVLAGASAVLGGCERKQRARERDAILAREQALEEAKRQAELAARPPPEEPPVELLRVPNSGLPCAVDDVFAAKCRRCHTIPPRHGAPFVFLTWQDTQQTRADQPLTVLIGRAVSSGFMPYSIEANPPVQKLTEDEKKIIMDWVDAGGPRQDCDPQNPNAPLPTASAAKRAAPASAKSATRAAPSAPADASPSPR